MSKAYFMFSYKNCNKVNALRCRRMPLNEGGIAGLLHILCQRANLELQSAFFFT